jgi:hypothetical protein
VAGVGMGVPEGLRRQEGWWGWRGRKVDGDDGEGEGALGTLKLGN